MVIKYERRCWSFEPEPTLLVPICPDLVKVREVVLGRVAVGGVTVVEEEAVAGALEGRAVALVEGDGVAAELPPDGVLVEVGALRLGAVLVLLVEQLEGAADVLPRRPQGWVVIHGPCNLIMEKNSQRFPTNVKWK